MNKSSINLYADKKANFSLKFERIKDVEPKKFNADGLTHFYVRIFLDQPKTSNEFFSMADVELVKYELHPTFRDRIRIATEARNNFEIRIWTYGFFHISCKIFLKGGKIEELTDFLRFNVSDSERANNKGELE